MVVLAETKKNIERYLQLEDKVLFKKTRSVMATEHVEQVLVEMGLHLPPYNYTRSKNKPEEIRGRCLNPDCEEENALSINVEKFKWNCVYKCAYNHLNENAHGGNIFHLIGLFYGENEKYGAAYILSLDNHFDEISPCVEFDREEVTEQAVDLQRIAETFVLPPVKEGDTPPTATVTHLHPPQKPQNDLSHLPEEVPLGANSTIQYGELELDSDNYVLTRKDRVASWKADSHMLDTLTTTLYGYHAHKPKV